MLLAQRYRLFSLSVVHDTSHLSSSHQRQQSIVTILLDNLRCSSHHQTISQQSQTAIVYCMLFGILFEWAFTGPFGRSLRHCMQIRDEDLQSGGNQDKARELQVEDKIEDAEKEQEYQTQMEHGLAVEESQSVSICSIRCAQCIKSGLLLSCSSAAMRTMSKPSRQHWAMSPVPVTL